MSATSTLKNKVIASIDRLPGKRLKEVVDFVEYLENKESAEATGEILADKRLLEGIRKGVEDLKAGRCKSWRSVRKNV
jgi:ribosomal protein L18